MASLLIINYDLILKNDRVITYVTVFGVLLSLFYSYIILTYLGPFRDTDQPVQSKDWRRYFIMIYALVNIGLNLFSIAYDPKSYKIGILLIFMIILYCVKGDDSEHIDHQSNSCWIALAFSIVSVLIIFGLGSVIVFKKINNKKLVNKESNGK